MVGCGGAAPQIPESASLAPADAVVFARITTDDDSSQWQKAERVLERIPGVRDTLVSAIEQQIVRRRPRLGDGCGSRTRRRGRRRRHRQAATDRPAPAGERGEACCVAREERRGVVPRRGGRMGCAGGEGRRPCRLPCGARARDDRRRRCFRRRARGAPRREPRSRVGRHGRSDRRAEPGLPAGHAGGDRPRDRLAVRVALRGGRRDARRDGRAHARRKRHALRADALPPRARGCSRRDLLRRDAGCARPIAGPGRRRRPLADDRRRDRCVARRHRRRALRRGSALRAPGRERFPRSRSRSRRPTRTRRGTRSTASPASSRARCKRP